MQDKSIRLGVDIGGTFTDVVLEHGKELFSTKVLTTYTAPENAIIDGMHRVCQQSGIDPARISQIIHGTTLATNALIERRGAKTALITTEGFRDVIEMRTESRFEQYDLNLTLPPPLLPRNFRYTIDERMQADGQVLKPLHRADIETLIDEINAAGFESVAVGLLHSYVNDAHERLVAEVLAERMPQAMVSLSSQVSPQMREYERFNTTIANAYIKPLMKSYLGRLKGQLADEGADCPIFLMHSGGGIISLENAAEFPVRLVESGPAGGAVFAAHIAARHGLDKVLSFDMGGTTAKICLIKNRLRKPQGFLRSPEPTDLRKVPACPSQYRLLIWLRLAQAVAPWHMWTACAKSGSDPKAQAQSPARPAMAEVVPAQLSQMQIWYWAV